jgi:cytochrome c6
MQEWRTGLPLLVVTAVCLVQVGCRTGGRESGQSGQEIFLIHCSGCHPNGGNVIYPQKTLDRMTLAANGITTTAGIVAKMRHPDAGMKQFDRETISDADAGMVAEYILATFK